MTNGTTASGAHGKLNTNCGAIDHTGNLLSELPLNALLYLSEQPLGREMRRKVEKRIRKMTKKA